MFAAKIPAIIAVLGTVFTLYGVMAWAGILAPRQLDARKQRQIAKLTAGAELLADAIARNGGDEVHLARLTAQYDAHARALTQLGQTVPAVPAAPILAQAA
ncbi:MAG: hypothetical protein WCO82_03390 [Sphingomonadales bacterium]